MPSVSNYDKFRLPPLVILASVVVATLFVWQGNKGFSLWDEGFLWYGAQRVMLGEVPIRDFMAYDPGRYYWAAAVMYLCKSNGIMALRIALAIFQAMGLSAGLLLIQRALTRQSLPYLLLCALTLTAWMFPRHKLFDVSFSIFLVGVLAYLVEKPVGRRFFFAGACVGLAAVFGRNHGVYGVAGSLGVIVWLTVKRSETHRPIGGLLAWSMGVITGYCPVLLMLLMVPGFSAAFVADIRYLFETKATNIPLPLPWPWRVDLTLLPAGEAVREILVGAFFIGLLAFGVLSLLWVIRQRMLKGPVSPALVAASFMALPYAHFAYSRADVSHLAQGIFPMLVGILVMLSRQAARVKWPLAFALCAASVWVMIAFQPGWECRGGQCIEVEISHSMLKTDPGTARDVALLRGLADKYARHGQSFVAAPYWPGAYALLERKSPLWEIYPLLRRSSTFEREEIARIEAARPGFTLIDEMPLDGVDALRFKNTHPLTYQYIQGNFVPLPASPDSDYRISIAANQAR